MTVLQELFKIFLKLDYLNYLLVFIGKTKLKYFIFSGGVANNVKANLYLSKINVVNKIFIPPGPGDENLSIGNFQFYCKKIWF